MNEPALRRPNAEANVIGLRALEAEGHDVSGARVIDRDEREPIGTASSRVGVDVHRITQAGANRDPRLALVDHRVADEAAAPKDAGRRAVARVALPFRDVFSEVGAGRGFSGAELRVCKADRCAGAGIAALIALSDLLAALLGAGFLGLAPLTGTAEILLNLLGHDVALGDLLESGVGQPFEECCPVGCVQGMETELAVRGQVVAGQVREVFGNGIELVLKRPYVWNLGESGEVRWKSRWMSDLAMNAPFQLTRTPDAGPVSRARSPASMM